MVKITGNTYPVKDSLRALGGRWNAGEKVSPVPIPSTFRTYRCKSCGCTASRYNRIYRNGLCSDRYRDEEEERDMDY